LISQESFNKFLDDIQKRIEEADKAFKERGDIALKANFDAYRQKISERLANELTLVEDCRRVGDDRGASHHMALVEVYKLIYAQTT
jgi:hypothetical protein